MSEAPVTDAIIDRVNRVRHRVAAAAARAGRDRSEITIVAAAKWQPTQARRLARDAGVRDIGENYAQELTANAAQVDGVCWHFVGRLQRNKIGPVLATGALVHSLDSIELARALGRRAAAAGCVARALVQVEVDERPAAHGVPATRLPAFLDACRGIDALDVRGLMTMPAHDGPDHARRAFATVAALGQDLPELPELSMGMSGDLEEAVAEGATMVRIGTALFGPRPGR